MPDREQSTPDPADLDDEMVIRILAIIDAGTELCDSSGQRQEAPSQARSVALSAALGAITDEEVDRRLPVLARTGVLRLGGLLDEGSGDIREFERAVKYIKSGCSFSITRYRLERFGGIFIVPGARS